MYIRFLFVLVVLVSSKRGHDDAPLRFRNSGTSVYTPNAQLLMQPATYTKSHDPGTVHVAPVQLQSIKHVLMLARPNLI